ncbi:bilirubin oxidase [Knoellia aerolata DSM 18566]|uniref:Bilirubin oxidase n=1 Tax=Knoellia aerolata DSM 18566 TaxID=1385519 RepID=A0A0A0JVS6_9MICO|nr:bilirubin oxidase [Knoellia aerolata DSM 18566]
MPKYAGSLLVPPPMPVTSAGAVDRYVIGVRQIRQQVLPRGLPSTTVWAYGSETAAGTHNAPSLSIEATAGRPVEVTWVNRLVNGTSGRYLPHLLPVDPTLHWANPGGGVAGRDGPPSFTSTPGPYEGPVPIVVHLHGGHSDQESDGYPEAWFLPDTRSIPDGYARVGTHYDAMAAGWAQRHGAGWAPGTQRAHYGNDQPAGTLWFHDHTLGITRLNVYAGPAGFFLLRGGAHDLEAGVLPHRGADGTPYELPLAIQDRAFRRDGSLFYPDTRAYFDEFAGPYVPHSDIAPIWNPEFFGNVMMVNGRTWPEHRVERRRYRLRLLNGCNSRFLILAMATDAAARPASPAAQFWQVGADLGFLPEPVPMQRLLLAPAERADVVVDFSGFPAGTRLFLINEGPDEPFGGGEPGDAFEWADPATTGQVMSFTVVDRVGPETSTSPEELSLPAPPPPPPAVRTRALALLEADSEVLADVGPRAAFLGTMAGAEAVPLAWDEPVTETPGLGDTEVWELHNHTEDAHPIHVHLVQFAVVDRQAPGGEARAPEPNETGPKDTVIAYPGEVTRVRAHFDKPGLFVWHCHILEHEDHEMMRPFRVE